MGLKTTTVCCGKKASCLQVLGGESASSQLNLNTEFSRPGETTPLSKPGKTNHAKEGHPRRSCFVHESTSVHSFHVAPFHFLWALEFVYLIVSYFGSWGPHYFFSVCFSNSSYSLTSQIQNSGELIRLVMVLCIASRYWLEILHWNAIEEPQTKNFRCLKLRAFQLGWKFPLITSSAEAFNIV